MSEQNKLYAFIHKGHKWHCINSSNELESYKLFVGKDLVAQVWPTEEDIKDSFSLAEKRYEDQVWETKENLSLNNALDEGGVHANQYIKQIENHGLPQRVPPYLMKHQGKSYIWTTDFREAPELRQYITDEKNEMIVQLDYIDEGGNNIMFYVMHKDYNTQKWFDCPYRTDHINDAYTYGEQKADKYFSAEKNHVSINITNEFSKDIQDLFPGDTCLTKEKERDRSNESEIALEPD